MVEIVVELKFILSLSHWHTWVWNRFRNKSSSIWGTPRYSDRFCSDRRYSDNPQLGCQVADCSWPGLRAGVPQWWPQTCFLKDGMTVNSWRIWRFLKSTPLVFTFSLLWP